MAFGVVGIFVGPVLLAVAYTLLDDWVGADPKTAATAERDQQSMKQWQRITR